MLLMPSLKRRLKTLEIKYLLVWILSILCVIWLMNSTYNIEANCKGGSGNGKGIRDGKGGGGKSNVEFVRIRDDVPEGNDEKFFANNNERAARQTDIKTSLEENSNLVVPYNRNMPLIFVGGVPRSGTTLMRAMLDAHPGVRCGEETRIIPRIIYMRNQWTNSKKENERLKNAGMTDEIIDSAVGSFILEVSSTLRIFWKAYFNNVDERLDLVV